MKKLKVQKFDNSVPFESICDWVLKVGPDGLLPWIKSLDNVACEPVISHVSQCQKCLSVYVLAMNFQGEMKDPVSPATCEKIQKNKDNFLEWFLRLTNKEEMMEVGNHLRNCNQCGISDEARTSVLKILSP